jgi:Ca-activated chloride channel homolog
MKRLAFALICLGMLIYAVPGQSNSSVRPRIAATPSPTPPVYEDEDVPYVEPNRRAPVLQGQPQSVEIKVPSANEEDDVIRVETNLVTMPVSVLDRNGRFVSGLTERDFRIFENGIEQEVGFFQSVEQPFTVVLMIDVSPSTAYQIDQIHQAAIAFVDQLRPVDRVMVVAFDEDFNILTRATNNRAQLHTAIRRAQWGNGTSIYSAMDRVLNRELALIEGRKAVVLFTDGVDTTSRRANFESTVKVAEESDVLIYPIRYNTARDYGRSTGGGVYRGPTGRRSGGWGDIVGVILGGGSIQMGGGGSAGTSPGEYARGREYLETLARNSGGRPFEADTLSNLDAAFAGIAEELRRQYSLGYYPDDPGNPGDRKQIRVQVQRPGLVVRAKSSYIVGQNGGRVAGR